MSPRTPRNIMGSSSIRRMILVVTILTFVCGLGLIYISESFSSNDADPRSLTLSGPSRWTLRSTSPVRCQNNDAMCGAIALVTALEIMEGRGSLSEHFLYYVARFDPLEGHLYPKYRRASCEKARVSMLKMLQESNFDLGLGADHGLRALVSHGTCPLGMEPVTPQINRMPSQDAFREARRHRIGGFVRLDDGCDPETVLERVRGYLQSGTPVVISFILFLNVALVSCGTGNLPVPDEGQMVADHAVVVVGYDDEMVIGSPGFSTTRGAFLIQNSWGTEWGDGGFGHLPYSYMTTSCHIEGIDHMDQPIYTERPLLSGVFVLLTDGKRGWGEGEGISFVSSHPYLVDEIDKSRHLMKC